MLGAIVDPRSPLSCYPLGILRLRGLITESEFSAGCGFKEETAKSALTGPPQSHLGKLDSVRVGAYVEPYRRGPTPELRKARKILKDAGGLVAQMVRRVCVEELFPEFMSPACLVGVRDPMLRVFPEFAALVEGLGALARHWGY